MAALAEAGVDGEVYRLLLDKRIVRPMSYLELLQLPVDEVPRLQIHLRILDRFERWQAVIEQHRTRHAAAVQSRAGGRRRGR